MSLWNPINLYDIASQSITKHYPLNKFGYNSEVGAIEKDIWEYNVSYNWQNVPIQLYASSDSNNDRSDGFGARTVILKGLDLDWMEQSSQLALDGQNKVKINKFFIRTFRAKVETAGNIGGSDGTIFFYFGTATAGVPDDPNKVFAIISPPHNQTLMALWTVPVGKMLYLTDWWASTGAAKTVEMHLYVRSKADREGVFQLKDIFHINNGSPWRQEYKLPFEIESKSDIVIRSHLVDSGGGPKNPVSAGFSGWYRNHRGNNV